MAQRETVTLATATDTYNFTRGHTYMWTRRGVRRRTGWWAFEYAIRDFFVSMTRWWRPRLVCSEIDREAGSITMEMQRWSWRRWRWERM